MNDCSLHKRFPFVGLDSYLLPPPPPPPPPPTYTHFQLETKPKQVTRNINIWHRHKMDNLNKNKIIHIWYGHEKGGQSDTFTSDTDLRRVVVTVTHSHLTQTWEGWWSQWHIHIWHRLEKGGGHSDTFILQGHEMGGHSNTFTWEGWSEWHIWHRHEKDGQWHIHIWHRLEKGGQSDTFVSDTDTRRVVTATHSYLTQTREGWPQWHIHIWHRHEKGNHRDTFISNRHEKGGHSDTFTSDTDMRRVVVTHSYPTWTWEGWSQRHIHIWHRHEIGGHSETFTSDTEWEWWYPTVMKTHLTQILKGLPQTLTHSDIT